MGINFPKVGTLEEEGTWLEWQLADNSVPPDRTRLRIFCSLTVSLYLGRQKDVTDNARLFLFHATWKNQATNVVQQHSYAVKPVKPFEPHILRSGHFALPSGLAGRFYYHQ